MNRSPRGHGKPFKFQRVYNVLVSLIEERRKRSRNLVPDSTACKVGSLKERERKGKNLLSKFKIVKVDLFLIYLYSIFSPSSFRPVFRPGRPKDPTSDVPGFVLFGFRVSLVSSSSLRLDLRLYQLLSHTQQKSQTLVPLN